MADTLAHQLAWLKGRYNYQLLKKDLPGKKPHDLVSPEHIAALEKAMHQGDFFADIPVMPGAQSVIQALCSRFDVFVATAAMDYPKSCHAKFDWLQRHFPFINKHRYVFCGDKSIVRADCLIDDSPRHFKGFVGHALLFNAPHNLHVDGYPRAGTWEEVAQALSQGI